MWQLILGNYWRVVLLKETPANTPYSPLLLTITSISYLAILILQWSIIDIKQEFTLNNSIGAGCTLLSSYYTYTWFLLLVRKQINRFLQTITALLSTNLLIHILAFPLVLLTPQLSTNNNSLIMLMLAVIYLMITLVLGIWQFLVTAHIYKHALEITLLPATLVSLGLVALNILTLSFWR